MGVLNPLESEPCQLTCKYLENKAFITAELDFRVKPFCSKLLASENVYCHRALAVLTVPIKLSLTIDACCFSIFAL